MHSRNFNQWHWCPFPIGWAPTAVQNCNIGCSSNLDLTLKTDWVSLSLTSWKRGLKATKGRLSRFSRVLSLVKNQSASDTLYRKNVHHTYPNLLVLITNIHHHSRHSRHSCVHGLIFRTGWTSWKKLTGPNKTGLYTSFMCFKTQPAIVKGNKDHPWEGPKRPCKRNIIKINEGPATSDQQLRPSINIWPQMLSCCDKAAPKFMSQELSKLCNGKGSKAAEM